MKLSRLIVFLLSLISFSIVTAGAQGRSAYPLTRGEDWDKHLGRRVVLIGQTENQKLGAALRVEERTVYLKGLSSWPPEFSNRMVRSIGILKRYDPPAAVSKDGEWSAGVTDPGKAYSLDKAKYDTEGCPPPN